MPLIAVAWVVGITILFYSSVLPNSVLDTRLDFFLLLPEIAPMALVPAASSSLASLAERIPYWLVSFGIVLAALAQGDLILQTVLKRAGLPSISYRLPIAAGLGLATTSLITLDLGSFGLLSRWLFWAILIASIVGWCVVTRPKLCEVSAKARFDRPSRLEIVALLIGLAFLATAFLGASLPSASFDNREYHLGGPKEYFQDGQITFLEHNVYTSFPFLTEMFVLQGMVLVDDWWSGAIVGQVVIASFALWTALLLLATGREVHPAVGPIAAVVWLTSPWCYRVSSTIAFVEGPLAYYVLAVLAAGWMYWRTQATGWAFILGCLAGSGMACKYPGLVQTVFPACVLLLIAFALKRNDAARGPFVKPVAALALGGLLSFGPWLVKNVIETGNPVYPLAYSLFGGVDLDDTWAQKWAGGHSPPFNVLAEPLRAVPDFFAKLADVFIKNDWQTPLVATFAPIGLVWAAMRRERLLIAAGAFALWLYIAWWAMTHQIDRFWVPMLPITCLLAAAGICWPWVNPAGEQQPPRWPGIVTTLVVLSIGYHWIFIGSGQAGFQQWLAPYAAAKRITASAAPGIQLLNESLPPEAKPLLIGEAQIFELKQRPVFNTVFDDSIFQQIVSADRTLPDADQPTADPTTICQRLNEQGVTHVFVNWSEVLRYRETYGYTDFVTPARMFELVAAGVLKPVRVDPAAIHIPWENVNESTQREIESWGPELLTTIQGSDALRRFDLYEVTCP